MLIQFNFKNYKSFRDEAILDCTAGNVSEFNERIIKVGHEKLLRVISIYGANASGKSNVYDAFKFMRGYVMESFKYGDESEMKSEPRMLKPIPFAFDKNVKEEASTFEVYFIDDSDPKNRMYNYGFSIKNNIVLEEWLNTKAKTMKTYNQLFYREGEIITFFNANESSNQSIQTALEKEVLVVSLGAKLKVDYLKDVRNWFFSCRFVSFGDPVENLFRARTLPVNFGEEEKVQKEVLDFFESFDTSIRGFEIKEKADEKKGGKVYEIDSMHKMVGSDELAAIHLEQESHGTLKMLALYPSLQEAIMNGSLLFVDELNARLHPLLLRNVLLIFLNPEINKKNAQLIFTSHDTWQLSNNLLRRDEIYFTEKNSDGLSELYSLDDFREEDGTKIRKDESYGKNYLYGKYGAIPDLKSISFFSED